MSSACLRAPETTVRDPSPPSVPLHHGSGGRCPVVIMAWRKEPQDWQKQGEPGLDLMEAEAENKATKEAPRDPLPRGRQREGIPGRGRRERSRSSPQAGGWPEPGASAQYGKAGLTVEFFWADWFRSVEVAPEQVGGKSEFKRAQWRGQHFCLARKCLTA